MPDASFQTLVDFAWDIMRTEWDRYEKGPRRRRGEMALHVAAVEQRLRPLVATARRQAPSLADCYSAAEVNARLDALFAAILAVASWEFDAPRGAEASDLAKHLGELDKRLLDARLSIQDLADVAATPGKRLADVPTPLAAGQGEGTGEGATPTPPGAGQGEGASVDEWIWAPDGNGYQVAGLGESGHFSRLKGLAMIGMLLRSPGRPVPMALLVGGVTGQPDGKRSKQPAMDMEALRATYNRIAALRAEVEHAESKGRTVEAAESRDELEQLQQELKAAIGIKGKVRDLNDLANKLRPSIHAALARVYKAMRKANPPLAEVASHLESAISSESGTFIYRPGGLRPPWRFELTPSEKEPE